MPFHQLFSFDRSAQKPARTADPGAATKVMRALFLQAMWKRWMLEQFIKETKHNSVSLVVFLADCILAGSEDTVITY